MKINRTPQELMNVEPRDWTVEEHAELQGWLAEERHNSPTSAAIAESYATAR